MSVIFNEPGGGQTLSNPSQQNNVFQFVQTTKPTERSAGVALVAGDRWYKNDSGTSWFWNGTYWLSTQLQSLEVPDGFSTGNEAYRFVIPKSSYATTTAFFFESLYVNFYSDCTIGAGTQITINLTSSLGNGTTLKQITATFNGAITTPYSEKKTLNTVINSSNSVKIYTSAEVGAGSPTIGNYSAKWTFREIYP